MKSVEQNRRSLAWFLDLAQQPESERESGIAEMGLQEFAHSIRPQLQVDWDAEPFGAPPTGPKPRRRRHATLADIKRAEEFSRQTGYSNREHIETVRQVEGRSKPETRQCKLCGRPGLYQTKPTKFERAGTWYCALHEAAAREQEAEDLQTDSIMRGLRAATPASAAEAAEGTDLGTLLRDVLAGLNSFLANSEWTFPPLTLTLTVSLASGKQRKPERQMMGALRDVVLAGISDLLIEHGHKIRRCKASNCDMAFLAVRRQNFCSKRCASNTRSERFQRKLGRKEFRERRRTYYVHKMQQLYGQDVKVKRRKSQRETIMSVYKRGEVYWFEFSFQAQRIREPAHTGSKTIARDAERARRRQLEDAANGIARRERPVLFPIAAERWLESLSGGLKPITLGHYRIYAGKLKERFHNRLVIDIDEQDIAGMQRALAAQGFAGRTVNLQIAVLRMILRYSGRGAEFRDMSECFGSAMT
jgi:hypothetical protein